MSTPTWYCAVSVATVWTSTEAVRPQDEAGLANPARPQEWIGSLRLADRLELSVADRVQTQLVYGEPVAVLKRTGNGQKCVPFGSHPVKTIGGIPAGFRFSN